ncbi:MAG: peptidyl-prolyl cis-trans isomerase [Silvibacterium sp.]|nr:peptidyl-prolyl cis-trans isomerase [Silvibacterium sp.]
MTLRFLLNRAALAASLAIAFVPTSYSQSTKPAAPAEQQSPYQGEVVEDIVARVNDQVISRSDYDRAEQDLEAQAKQQQWTQQQLYGAKHDLLRDLIDQQLLLSKGKDLDITGETELVKRLDEMRKQNHLDSMEDLQKAAEAQGVSWEDFKASIRNRIVTQEVIRDQVGRHVNITPTEVQNYYNQHKQEFDQPEQVRLSEILIPTGNPDDAAQVAAAKNKADDLEAKLKAGSDFAALAKNSSGGPTAADGGDLGQFKRGQLAKVLEDATFGLKPGQYTEPIRTKQGYVILKVTEHNPGGIPPLKDVEPQVEDAVGMAKMNPALRDYLTRLREDAYIDISKGYEDSAASPNEMKPVYSAYTPPSPKKKHVQRTRFRARGRNATKAAPTQTAAAGAPAAPAPPPGVPSLADVPQGSATATNADVPAAPAPAGAPAPGSPAAAAPASAASAPAPAATTQTASAKTMKPGKKEKIRFGQAPRETLPTAETKTEDAAAGSAAGTEVATNAGPTSVHTLNPDGTVANPDTEAPKQKTRFQDRAKQPKEKKQNGPKTDAFAPPAATQDETADRQQQSQALGLNGDTSKVKKSNPAKTGPKRRMSDEKKNGEQPDSNAPAPSNSAPASEQPPAPASQTGSSTPAPAPAPPAAPAAPNQ